MDIVIKSNINFDNEYKFIENLKMIRIKEVLDNLVGGFDIINYLNELNKNDLML